MLNFDSPELDAYARLSERELLNLDHPEDGRFIAESPKVILRALDAGYEPLSLLTLPEHIAGEAAEIIARCPDIPVYTAPESELVKLTGFKLTRGTLCAMRRRAPPAPEELLRGARRVAVLERVMNPTNLGAIFRSAAAMFIDAVLLTPGCCDPLYRRAVRVSMGNVFQVPWAHLPEDWPALLHAQGFRIAAMALSDDSIPVDEPRLAAEERLAITLGTEGDGLTDAALAAADDIVRIPMAPGVDSLNVAAASAVAFWQLRAK